MILFLKIVRRGLLTVLFALSLLFINSNLKAETYTVDDLVDADDTCVAGSCSLREAVKLANGTPESDEIKFTVKGTHELTLGELQITGRLIIEGISPEDTIIDAKEKSRVINALADLGLKNLTLQNGKIFNGSGAGINSMNHSLVVENCVIRNNHQSEDNDQSLGGGISYLTSTENRNFKLNKTILDNNSSTRGGDAVYYASYVGNNSLEITDSQFVNHVGSNTFFAFLTPTMKTYSITGSLFKSNTVSYVLNSLMQINSPDLAFFEISNSTFSDNFVQARNLISSSGANLTLKNLTFTKNNLKDAILSIAPAPAIIRLLNTILDDTITNCKPSLGAQIISLGGNLSRDTSCFDGQDPSDQINLIDMKLAPLADNGGLTWTHALLANSPALDSGVKILDTPAQDQRGQARNDSPDSGAFESVCGDGVKSGNEICDDGNQVDNDTCSNQCVPVLIEPPLPPDEEPEEPPQEEPPQEEPPQEEPQPLPPEEEPQPPVSPVCGNGIVETGEECDGGEACNADCTVKVKEPPPFIFGGGCSLKK